jgi:hypothetical protein
MKKLVLIIILFNSLVLTSFAKKDTSAWKAEKNLGQQYSVFKENLNYWSGNYFMSGPQLDEFFGAMTDSISALQQKVENGQARIKEQSEQLEAKQSLVDETQQKLDESIRNQNSISVFGIPVNKSVYSTSMYLFILGVLALAAIVFLMYRRAHKITSQTKKEFEELKAEYEEHKKNALDRYTAINMELHKTRLELQKK